MAPTQKRNIDASEGSRNDNKDENQGGRVNWSKQLLDLLCDLCIQYVEKSKGKKGGVTSQRLMWKKIELEFNKKSNLTWDKNKLKNKVDWMRSRWSLWKQLKAKETGLGWDNVKGTISANDEWWTMKIKENSKFDSFRDEGIEPELEYKMDQIFGSYAQGKYKFSPVANSSYENEIHEEYVPSPPHRNDEHVSLDDTNLNDGDDNYYGGASWDDVWRESSPIPQVTQVDSDDIRRGKRAFEGDSSLSNKSARTSTKRGGVANIQQMLGDLMQQINERNVSSQEMNTSMVNMMNANMNLINSMNATVTKYGVEDALAKVCSLPGLEPHAPEFFFACTMIEDPQKRSIFFGLPDDESRVGYIKYLHDHEKHPKS